MKKIYLIDGNSFIYRMFYALPEFSTKDGTIVNALFGMAKFFTSTLVKEKPDYVVFVKDARGENFRHKLYADYKATREKMPNNLVSQISLIEEMLSLMNIKIIEISGYEADDVIGTLATSLGKKDIFEIDILTGDKDLFSLVSNNVKIYDTMKKKKFGPDETKEKFGIPSNMIIDYLAIVGDNSDNIPGIPGFGPQKAVDLINNIGGVDEIFSWVEKGEEEFKDLPLAVQPYFRGKTFEKLASSKEIAFLSKKLATINLDVPLDDFNIDEFEFSQEKVVNEFVIQFFEKYEFNSLIGENSFKKLETWEDLNLKVQIVDNKDKLRKLLEECLKTSTLTPLLSGEGEREKCIVLDTETTSLDIISAELVGISIYLDDERIYYINRLHSGNKVSDLDLQDFVRKLLNSNLLIVGHNLKYDLEILEMFLTSSGETSSFGKDESVQISLF